MESTQDGTLQLVTVEMLGTALTVAATVSATTLTVDWAVDFPEPDEGKTGLLRLGGVEYTYDEVDKEADTIHLTSPVTVAAAAGDPVDAMSEAGRQAEVWTAHLEPGDEDAEPIAATIPTALIGYFVEGEDQAGAAVTYVAQADGTYRVVSQPDRQSNLDGAMVWNPYVSRRALTESIPHNTWEELEDWTNVLFNGVTIEANGSVTIIHPGLYAIDATPAFASNPTNQRVARIKVNGVETGYVGVPADSAGVTDVVVLARPFLVTGDNVTIEVYQSSGASLNVYSGVGRSFFSLYRISV